MDYWVEQNQEQLNNAYWAIDSTMEYEDFCTLLYEINYHVANKVSRPVPCQLEND